MGSSCARLTMIHVELQQLEFYLREYDGPLKLETCHFSCGQQSNKLGEEKI